MDLLNKMHKMNASKNPNAYIDGDDFNVIG
jgi:hypothetical protein